MGVNLNAKRPLRRAYTLLIAMSVVALVSRLSAVQIGDTREAVLTEKGAPVGQMGSSAMEILKFTDQVFKLRHGKVVAIEATVPAQSPSPVSLAPRAKAQAVPRERLQVSGSLGETPAYLIYLPKGLIPGRKYPLVFALSPTGNALSMISTWTAVADKRSWIVAASTEFKHGAKFSASMDALNAALTEIGQTYAVDPTRVIFSGFSDGGMGAHAFAQFHAERVRAVVINTGIIQPSFMNDRYPSGKTAVLIGSPTDPRFAEMKRDQAFLDQRGW
ncbi:MAG TPA: hypothetical protein VL069_16790, partial [Opitutus sp.]|nr:hypothetical protein [Opitutus sp.]